MRVLGAGIIIGFGLAFGLSRADRSEGEELARDPLYVEELVLRHDKICG